MHKIGLKLWSVNQNYIDEARRLFLEGVYDYIELYVVPESLSFLPIWEELRIPFVIHAPHFGHQVNLADANKIKYNRKLIEETQLFADRLKARYIIVHPGVNGVIEETSRQLKKIRDSRILIENKPYLGLSGVVCVGSRPEEIEYVMKECGVGCCLDIGHAICAGNSHKIGKIVFLRELIALRPSMHHLTDGEWYSEYDSHEHLGDGNYDLETLTKLVDSDKPVTLETEKNSKYNLEDFEKDVACLEDLGGGFRIRRAEPKDCLAVYNLSNNPEVRTQSINSDAISLDDHKRWYNHKINDPKGLFYVIK